MVSHGTEEQCTIKYADQIFLSICGIIFNKNQDLVKTTIPSVVLATI